jgi:hypothetical protein
MLENRLSNLVQPAFLFITSIFRGWKDSGYWCPGKGKTGKQWEHYPKKSFFEYFPTGEIGNDDNLYDAHWSYAHQPMLLFYKTTGNLTLFGIMHIAISTTS